MLNEDPYQVCEECKKKTKIVYDSAPNYFMKPRFRHVDDLRLGKSGMITNPIILIAEWVYDRYKDISIAWYNFKKRLFPRRDKIWCNTADSALVGKINYADRDNLNTPIHNLYVEYWARTWWLQWRKLATGYSDYDGTFSLPFELRQARNWKILFTRFEIHQTTYRYYEENKPIPDYTLFYKEKVPVANLTGMRYNLRTIHLHLWEYRRHVDVPRTEIHNIITEAPQKYHEGRMNMLYEQIIPLEIIKLKHLTQIATAPETISIKSIQADYPENLTCCIEKKLPGYTRGDDWFGRRMMNGMNRGTFLPDSENPAHYWIKYFGICNYDHGDEYALPTVEIKFKLKDDGFPLPIEIHITGPTNAYDKDPWQKKVFTPASGDEWMYAKRVARVNGAFSTEVDEHFSGTHLNTEQYAIAANRNLRLNPIACLLLAHLRSVELINYSADTVLIKEYIPSATALTEKGLHERCRDLLGMQDWKDWQPMKVINNVHYCARAEQMFWGVVNEYVDKFFAENLEGIKKHWREVHLFSQDLVTHAVPVFLSNVDMDKLSVEERKLAEERFEYYAYQYGFDVNAKRATVNGELKVVSPITNSDTYENAQPGDMDNLNKICKYAIMMATYMHTWINEHQYDDLGEILYSSGGLRYGQKKEGILAPESDLGIAPDLTRGTEMLWLTNFLSRTEYGFITRNEEHDVNPLFAKMLLAKEKEFLDVGVDVNTIESRTNI